MWALTTSATVAEHLMFRSADGSLAIAGIWMIGLGIGMVVVSIANLAGRGPTKRLAGRVPHFVLVAWGCLGLVVGGFFIVWPLMASPGVLY